MATRKTELVLLAKIEEYFGPSDLAHRSADPRRILAHELTELMDLALEDALGAAADVATTAESSGFDARCVLDWIRERGLDSPDVVGSQDIVWRLQDICKRGESAMAVLDNADHRIATALG